MTSEEKEAIIQYRLKRAKETLAEVDLHIKNELYNTAVNRLYYACYYAVSALLLKNDIKTTTHSGVRQMFGANFVKTGFFEKEIGKFYSEIFDMRQTGDYDDLIDHSIEDIRQLLEPAKSLINTIQKFLSS